MDTFWPIFIAIAGERANKQQGLSIVCLLVSQSLSIMVYLKVALPCDEWYVIIDK